LRVELKRGLCIGSVSCYGELRNDETNFEAVLQWLVARRWVGSPRIGIL